MKAKVIGKYNHGAVKKLQTADGKQYFLDNRINSKTRGKIFDIHPDLKSAKQVDIIITELKEK